MLDLVGERGALLEPRGETRSPADPIESARTLAQRLFELAPVGDAQGRLDPGSLAALHASGLPLAVFPPRHGGVGLVGEGGAERLAAVLRLVGAGDLSVARLFEGHVNAVTLVTTYGTERQSAGLAQAVRDGALSAVWNAEGRRPLAGRRVDDEWLLSGEKILASGAGLISHPIVTPRTGDGVVMLIVEGVGAERSNLTGWTPQGMRASATGTADISGLGVPVASQIGLPGDYLRQPVFSGGAWRFCAVHLGAAERLLDLFRADLRVRGRDEDPYQRQRVATATSACITARLWIEKTAVMAASPDADAEAAVAFVNLTRGVTERACLDVIEIVQRGAGLSAFIRPNPVERIARDLATYLRQPVPDAAMADAARVILASDASVFDLWSA